MTTFPPYPEANKHTYRPDIDGLRAIAVLAVVAFHFFPEWVRGGFIGVDIFFVISGFLISTIIYKELEQHTFSFIDFYSRRVRRIFPALILVLLSCLALGWYVLLADEYKQLGQHVLAGSVFSSNLMLWSESGYFDNASETKPLLHLWSLGIEEQFYFIWPLLLWGLYKKKNNIFLITLLIALSSFVANIYVVGINPVADFYSPMTRFWELMIGSIVAYLLFYKPQYLIRWRGRSIINKGVFNEILSGVGLCLLASALFLLTKESSFPGWWALLPTLGAAFLILGGQETSANSKILSNPFLVWVGLISFPLYLWHWPLLSMARIVEGGAPTVSWRLAIAALSIALAWLTFRLIEKPLRFGGYAKVKTIVLIVILGVVGALGYYVFAKDGIGVRFRLNESTQQLLIRDPEPEMDRRLCAKRYPELANLEYCGLSKNSSPTVAIIGDSHAYHFYSSFKKLLNDQSIVLLKHSSCLPFSSDAMLQRDDCEKRISDAVRFLGLQTSVKTIYISGYWSYLISSGYGEQGDNWQIPKDAKASDINTFFRNGSIFLNKINQMDKEIILIRETPNLNFNIKKCLNIRPFFLSKDPLKNCMIQRDDYENRIHESNKILSKLEEVSSLKIFDPTSIFCDEIFCRSIDGNIPMYIDGHHLNKYGADLVIRSLLLKYPPHEN